MVLLLAVAAGLLAGWIRVQIQARPYRIPSLHSPWLVVLGFLPQLFVFYLPGTRNHIPDWFASFGLVFSQILLLVFVWLNRKQAGMWLLIIGLTCNLAVIVLNGGLMPISPQTAARLVSEENLASMTLGDRFGTGKDVLLNPQDTILPILSDRFLLPACFPYQVAFSLGDVLLGMGVFWFLMIGCTPLQIQKKQPADDHSICTTD